MNKKLLLAVLVVTAQLFAVNPDYPYDDRRAPLHEAPHENPPMLIALSSDDNYNLEGMEWMLNTLKSRRHADSSVLRMTFFCNTRWGSWIETKKLYATFREAYDWGNEVTSHTARHIPCVWTINGELVRLSDDSIYTDIQHSLDDLKGIGIPKEHMFGFRTPYVATTDSTFTAVKRSGFLYDASSIDGHTSRPGNFHWPFTIDTPNDTLLNEDGLELPPAWWDTATMGPKPEPIEVSYLPGNHLSFCGNNYTNRAPIRRHSGLWEFPFNCFYVPDSLVPYLDEVLGHVTNGLAGACIEELIQGDTTDSKEPVAYGTEMTKEQALATLIYTFEETYAGNRSPMSVVFHTPNFSETLTDYDHYYPYCSDPRDRQWIIEQFIDYALQKEEVWFVNGEQVINYCKNPVSADEFHPDDFTVIPVTANTAIHKTSGKVAANNVVQIKAGNTLSLEIGTKGVYSVKILSLNGRELFSLNSSLSQGTHLVDISEISFTGVAVVQIKTGRQVQYQQVLLQ